MLEQLLNELGSWRSAARSEGIEQARKLTPDQLVELIALADNRDRRRRPYQYLVICIVTALIFTVFGIAAARPDIDPMAVCFLMGIFLLSPFVLAFFPSHSRRSINTILAKINDPASVAAILTILASSPHLGEGLSGRNQLSSTLARLMPHITPELARTWTKEQRRGFCQPLILLGDPQVRNGMPKDRYSSMCGRAIEVLKAMEQIGDEREMDCIRKLADLKPRRPQDAQLRAAAIECLPSLEVRASEHDRQQTLLRASDAPTHHASETLLRPAADQGTVTSGEMLLRPTVEGK